jgi:hypothetical protein
VPVDVSGKVSAFVLVTIEHEGIERDLHAGREGCVKMATADHGDSYMPYNFHLTIDGQPVGAPSAMVSGLSTDHSVTDDSEEAISGAVAGVVGIEGGVVSGVFNLESSDVRASDWRPRHDKRYHEA